MHTMKGNALYNALENPRSRWFAISNDVLAALTIISILGIALETVDAFTAYGAVFRSIEYTVVAVFTIEYLIRFSGRGLKYTFSFFGIIDLLAVLPSYLAFANLTFLKSARILRILRFLRILRLAKLGRRLRHPTTAAEDMARLRWINAQIYAFALLSAIVIFGAFVHAAEGGRPEFSNMFLGMLWSAKIILGGVPQTEVATLWGEVTVVLARFTGLALFGLLITVIGGFVQRLLFGTRLRGDGHHRDDRADR